MSQILINVPKELLDSLKPGEMIELVKRDAKKKYLPFIKGIINGDASEESKEVAHRMLKMLKENELNSKKLHADMKCIKALNYLNIGLEIANIAVDIAGFVIIANKLNGLEDSIKQLSKEVSRLNDFNAGNIEEQFDYFKSKYLEYSRKIQDGDDIDMDKLIDSIASMKAFIKKLLMFYENDTIDRENLLNIFAILLPAYSHLLQWYMIEYFYDKGKSIDAEPYLDVFKTIMADKFRATTLDYFFNDKHLHNLEAIVATNDLIMIDGYSHVITIRDEALKLNRLKTKEKYDEYNEYINKIVEQRYESESAVQSKN